MPKIDQLHQRMKKSTYLLTQPCICCLLCMFICTCAQPSMYYLLFVCLYILAHSLLALCIMEIYWLIWSSSVISNVCLCVRKFSSYWAWLLNQHRIRSLDSKNCEVLFESLLGSGIEVGFGFYAQSRILVNINSWNRLSLKIKL